MKKASKGSNEGENWKKGHEKKEGMKERKGKERKGKERKGRKERKEERYSDRVMDKIGAKSWGMNEG
jgi:hypothetical protein